MTRPGRGRGCPAYLPPPLSEVTRGCPLNERGATPTVRRSGPLDSEATPVRVTSRIRMRLRMRYSFVWVVAAQLLPTAWILTSSVIGHHHRVLLASYAGDDR